VTAATLGRSLGILFMRALRAWRWAAALLGAALIVVAVSRWSPLAGQCLAGATLLVIAAGKPLLSTLTRRTP
jgi:hypothetical protein